MKPVKFPEANACLGAPPGMEKEVEPLHVYRDGTYHISVWTLSWSERLRVLFTGKVWLWVMMAHTQPQVSIDVRDPWTKKVESRIAELGNKVGFIRRWKARRAVRQAVRDALREGGK